MVLEQTVGKGRYNALVMPTGEACLLRVHFVSPPRVGSRFQYRGTYWVLSAADGSGACFTARIATPSPAARR